LTAERPTILVTRPTEASARFAMLARARLGADWPILISPLSETVYQRPALPSGSCDGLLFTSEAAVRGFAPLTSDRALRAYCVGPRTARAAAAAGFPAVAGPGDARGLASLIRAAGPARLLYPRGAEVAEEMGALLAPDGIVVAPLVVYAQEPRGLSHEAFALLAAPAPVLVPLFSRRSAQRFVENLPVGHAPLWIATISTGVAEAATAAGPAALAIATRPDAEAVLDALVKLAQRAALG